MRRSKFSEQQIIGILKEHEAGQSAAELCRKHGISDPTFYKWRTKYGGMEVSDARKLKGLDVARQEKWPLSDRQMSGRRVRRECID